MPRADVIRPGLSPETRPATRDLPHRSAGAPTVEQVRALAPTIDGNRSARAKIGRIGRHWAFETI